MPLKRTATAAACLLAVLSASPLFLGCSKDDNPASTGQPQAANLAPVSPYNPSPADSATGVACPLVVNWTCYDPDLGDTLSYQVVMGAGAYTDTFILFRTTAFLVDSLSPAADYTWKVTATDNHGAAASGPVWHFRTY